MKGRFLINLGFERYIQGIPAFRDFTIRDPRHFVILLKPPNLWIPRHFVILKKKITKKKKKFRDFFRKILYYFLSFLYFFYLKSSK